MSDGFLGYDASFMLDAVVCALVLVVPALIYGLYLVKVKRAYRAHRNWQIALGLVLLATVTAFEIDLQIVHGGWLNIANKNPDSPRLVGEQMDLARLILRVHLIFAVTTPLLWITTTVLALRRYSNPPLPGPHSPLHSKLGWLSVLDLVLTSITGVGFYYVAFVAS